MRTPAEITGGSLVARDIAHEFRTGTSAVAALIGPSGSGKTSCATEIANALGDRFSVTIWRGGAILESTAEAVLASNQPRRPEGRFKGVALDLVEDVGNLILSGHLPFAKTIRTVVGWKIKPAKQRSLTVAQQNFLFCVSAVERKKAPLIICDDLHYWDKDSLDFLIQAARGAWNDIYPVLGSARFLLIWTPEQAKPGFLSLIKRRFGQRLRSHKLGRVKRNDFKELLVSLGASPDLPGDVCNSIFAICHGHLAFARQIAALLGPEESMSSALATSPDLHQSLFEILQQRLDDLPDGSDAVSTLIEAISTLGEALRLEDLACLFKGSAISVPAVLRHATEMGLLQETHKLVRVSHEIIQNVVAKYMPADQREWHAKFARCLRDLRPSDYDRRALHHLKAGETLDADVMRIHAVLARVRQGKLQPGESWTQAASIQNPSLAAFVDRIEQASNLELARRYDDAILYLHKTPPPRVAQHQFESLEAERDLLLARLYLMLRDDRSRTVALELCERWEDFAEEGELWSRIAETRLVILSHLRRHEEGRDIEYRLLARYRQRKTFDPDAGFSEARLKRRGEAIHAPRIAHRMLEEALNFFDPDGLGEAPRDIVEFLITLNNLGANELVIGQFASAVERLKIAVGILSRTSPPLLRRSELVFSNLVVAHHLATGEVAPLVQELMKMFEALSVQHSDVALLRSNMSCLIAKSGDIERAWKCLRRTQGEISAIDGFSRYSVYFINSNFAVLEYLKSRTQNGLAILHQTIPVVSSLPIDMQPYALRRLRLLIAAMETDHGASLGDLESTVQGIRPEVGESWGFYGRALALTDLQFWTES